MREVRARRRWLRLMGHRRRRMVEVKEGFGGRGLTRWMRVKVPRARVFVTDVKLRAVAAKTRGAPSEWLTSGAGGDKRMTWGGFLLALRYRLRRASAIGAMGS